MSSLKVNEYIRPDGKYQVTIAPNTTSYWGWNYKRLVAEYPKKVKQLSKLGFTNKSRDLHLKAFGIPSAFDTKEEAAPVARLYEVILNGI